MLFYFSDGEAAEAEALARYRQQNGLAPDFDLSSIGLQILSVEWMKSKPETAAEVAP